MVSIKQTAANKNNDTRISYIILGKTVVPKKFTVVSNKKDTNETTMLANIQW